jgi:sterol desaturase/sphingolipid hydroxylase (fatty acid hydroxylase superfamily)
MNTTVWQHRVSNWACGALTVLVSLTVGSGILALYRWLSAHALLHWSLSPPFTFALAFVGLDLLYYLQHRAEHRSKWLWAVHEVHHQSNICDASVSLRTSALSPLAVLTIHLPLALLGLPFGIYLAAYVAHTALVFLLHSRTPRWMDRPGILFNSPYLHRGHHSNAPDLRGKNLGGVFIVWDRLFGTFERRCDVTTFGVGSQQTELNPLKANWAPLRRLVPLRP